MNTTQQQTETLNGQDLARRQQQEWTAQTALWLEAFDNRDIDLAKLAKVMAECLKIRHEGERKVHAVMENESALAGEATVQWQ